MSLALWPANGVSSSQAALHDRVFDFGDSQKLRHLIGVCISGCASPQMAWIRIDGVRGNSDPVLTRQFELDKTSCLGEAPGNSWHTA
jgi:hypothetical protein